MCLSSQARHVGFAFVARHVGQCDSDRTIFDHLGMKGASSGSVVGKIPVARGFK